MHEARETDLETGGKKVDRPEHVDREHPAHIRLRRIGTVRSCVEDQVWLDRADEPGDRAGIDEIRFVNGCVLGNSLKSPTIAPGPYDEMHVVAVMAQPAREVRSDEPGRAGDERPAFRQQSP